MGKWEIINSSRGNWLFCVKWFFSTVTVHASVDWYFVLNEFAELKCQLTYKSQNISVITMQKEKKITAALGAVSNEMEKYSSCMWQEHMTLLRWYCSKETLPWTIYTLILFFMRRHLMLSSSLSLPLSWQVWMSCSFVLFPSHFRCIFNNIIYDDELSPRV